MVGVVPEPAQPTSADDDYMGRSSGHEGYERIDSVVEWCRANNLYLILDMHDAPGGQYRHA